MLRRVLSEESANIVSVHLSTGTNSNVEKRGAERSIWMPPASRVRRMRSRLRSPAPARERRPRRVCCCCSLQLRLRLRSARRRARTARRRASASSTPTCARAPTCRAARPPRRRPSDPPSRPAREGTPPIMSRLNSWCALDPLKGYRSFDLPSGWITYLCLTDKYKYTYLKVNIWLL